MILIVLVSNMTSVEDLVSQNQEHNLPWEGYERFSRPSSSNFQVSINKNCREIEPDSRKLTGASAKSRQCERFKRVLIGSTQTDS